MTPLSPDRYKYQLTIGGSTLEKLRLAKDMLRHALPSGDDEAILDRALTALLTELARKKFGGERKTGSSDTVTDASRNAAPGSDDVEATDSRRVPVEVRRAVWVRDLGRCAFVAADGRRCGERALVEFHHVRPYAAGGKPTVDNIQLRCWHHNGYEARVFFAREPVDEGQHRERPPIPHECQARRPCEVVPERVTLTAGVVLERLGAIATLSQHQPRRSEVAREP